MNLTLIFGVAHPNWGSNCRIDYRLFFVGVCFTWVDCSNCDLNVARILPLPVSSFMKNSAIWETSEDHICFRASAATSPTFSEHLVLIDVEPILVFFFFSHRLLRRPDVRLLELTWFFFFVSTSFVIVQFFSSRLLTSRRRYCQRQFLLFTFVPVPTYSDNRQMTDKCCAGLFHSFFPPRLKTFPMRRS
jgi:hypothetical protein